MKEFFFFVEGNKQDLKQSKQLRGLLPHNLHKHILYILQIILLKRVPMQKIQNQF